MAGILILLFSLTFYCCKNAEEAGQETFRLEDDIGCEITFENIPQKIISAAPNLTEILFKLGLGDKIIGVTNLCDFPSDAKSKEIVGDLLNLNYEKIISLKPDILFITVEGNTKESYNKLSELGIKVFVTNPRSLKGIDKTIIDFGKIFKLEEIADNIVSEFELRKNKILSSTKSSSKKSVFIVSFSPLIIAGKNTFINELLTACGLDNIAGNSIVPYPVYSREEVLNKNPEIILSTLDLIKNKDEILNLFPEWQNISAIKKNQVLLLQSDIFLRPGPRYIDAIEILHDKINKFQR